MKTITPPADEQAQQDAIKLNVETGRNLSIDIKNAHTIADFVHNGGDLAPIDALHQAIDRLAGYAQQDAAKVDAQPVAYLEVGEGGYVDLGSDKSSEELESFPPGKHQLYMHPAQSDPAMAGDDWEEELILLLDEYSRSHNPQSFLDRTSVYQAIRTHARKRVHPASAQWVEHNDIRDIPDAILTDAGLALKQSQVSGADA